MKKSNKKIMLIILLVLTIGLCVYAFFIASPKDIFLKFFGDDDNTVTIANNDNINGIYKYSEPLDRYYQIYSSCRINSIDKKILIINDRFYLYRSTCIATYLEGAGDTSDLKIEYNEVQKTFQLTYKDKVYIKTGEGVIKPGENFYKNTSSFTIESLNIVLNQLMTDGHEKEIRIGELRSKLGYSLNIFPPDYLLGKTEQPVENIEEEPTEEPEDPEEPAVNSNNRVVDKSQDNNKYRMEFLKKDGTITREVAYYAFTDLNHIPEFYKSGSTIEVLINNSVKNKYNYTIQLITPMGVNYYFEDEFPIVVNGEEITMENYNVYIKRNRRNNTFDLYFSKYHDFCINDKKSDEVIYYEFNLKYNSAKKTYNKPEFVGKRLAKEGCNNILDVEPEIEEEPEPEPEEPEEPTPESDEDQNPEEEPEEPDEENEEEE